MEFYRFFELCSFLGLGVIPSRKQRPPILWFAAVTAIGILASHAAWMLYLRTPFGPANEVMGHMDIVSFCRSWFN
jgi:hypothetical protein